MNCVACELYLNKAVFKKFLTSPAGLLRGCFILSPLVVTLAYLLPSTLTCSENTQADSDNTKPPQTRWIQAAQVAYKRM